MNGSENKTDAAAPACACETKKCKCGFFRKLLIFILVVIAGASVFIKYKRGEPFNSAHQKVLADATVKETLGEPLSMTQLIPSGSSSDNMYWGIKGPNGRATVELQARLVDGKWEFVHLDVVLADRSKRIPIAVESGNDAAPFGAAPATPAGTSAEKKEEKPAAPPQLNFDVGGEPAK